MRDTPGTREAGAARHWDPIRAAALAAAVAAGVAAWGVGVACRGYDYDEVLRAHETWLVAHGDRPYDDFFEAHPPYFVLLTPFVRAFDDPYHSLVALRVFAAAGNLAFLAGLAAVGGASVASGRLWAWLGVLVVACRPGVLSFLTEFRVDGWGYAVAVWSLFRFRRASGAYRFAEMGFLTGLATLLLCPKLAPLPPAVVLFEGLAARKGWAGFARGSAGYAFGLGLAGAAFGLFLVAQRVEPTRTFTFVFLSMSKYNASYMSRFGRGLAAEAFGSPVLTPLVAAGLAAWLAGWVRRKSPPDAYHAAVAAWLAAQLVFVSFPFKQYAAPWFLFGSGFLAFLGPPLSRLPGPVGAAVFVSACGLSGYSAAAEAAAWYRDNPAGYERSMIRFMNRVSLPGDHVVAASPHHPVYRRDVFYLAISTLDHGYDADQILDDFPAARGLVTARRYREELAAHPPAFVLLHNAGEEMPYSARQNRVLLSFVRERAYRELTVGGVTFAVRPDRFDGLVNGPRPDRPRAGSRGVPR